MLEAFRHALARVKFGLNVDIGQVSDARDLFGLSCGKRGRTQKTRDSTGAAQPKNITTRRKMEAVFHVSSLCYRRDRKATLSYLR